MRLDEVKTKLDARINKMQELVGEVNMFFFT